MSAAARRRKSTRARELVLLSEMQSGSRPWSDHGASSSPFVGRLQTEGRLPLRTRTDRLGEGGKIRCPREAGAAASGELWLCRIGGGMRD